MAKLTTNAAVTVDYSADGWPEFVKWLDGTYASLRYAWADDGAAYSIVAVDGAVARTCGINKGEDAADFEEHYKKPLSAGGPTTSDGKPIYLPNMFPGEVTLYYAGAGDDETNAAAKTTGAGRGGGVEFSKAVSAQGDTDVDIAFNDWLYLAGGILKSAGGKIGDSISCKAVAPATGVVPNGGGTGNCNRVGPGGVLIVPAAGDGAYDVDLASAVPVPAVGLNGEPTGYFDWDDPDVGYGTLTPAVPGYWNLYVIPIDLARFANKVQTIDDDQIVLTAESIKPKKILPQWRLRITIHNVDGTHELQVSWLLKTARVKTID